MTPILDLVATIAVWRNPRRPAPSAERRGSRAASTLEDVKILLGHSPITLTSNTYGHVLEQRQRQVARAIDAVLGG
jgi:hypothetical protein